MLAALGTIGAGNLLTTAMSPPSPDALYHPIPQAPVAANPVLPPDPRLDSADADETDDILPGEDNDRRPVVVDTKLWWINCLLGCAVLLPWNGE